MANSLLPIACLLLTTGVWCDDVPKPADDTKVTEAAAEPHTGFNEKFTTRLMQELSTSPGGNIIFSPLSIDTAMGIVGFGAAGETQKQIFEVLGYHADEAKSQLTKKQTIINEEPAPGAIWKTANRIMVDPSLALLEDYTNEVATSFPGSVIGQFDFSNAEGVVKEVNSWAEEKTKGVIKEILSKGDLDERVKLIVLNAIYFKGTWLHGFPKEATRKDCFYSKPDQCTMTDMMHQQDKFKYGFHDDLKAEVIEFPYKNEDFSMVVVLPDEKHSNLTSLITNMDVDEILKFIDAQSRSKVQVTFPKFETEFKSEMKHALIKMGMKQVFSQTSDLSKMIAGLRTQVNSVIQKAKITCDEEGTVAAAVTGALGVARSFEAAIVIMEIDHPFLFILRHKSAGVLFAGQQVIFSN